MSYLKDHVAPTLHNAIGSIISTALLGAGALLTFVKPLRERVLPLATVNVPLWMFAVVILICILLLRAQRKKLRAQRIEIHSAQYGTGSAQVDVTDRVRECVHDGILNVLATTTELGCTDPLPGYMKSLTINYSLNGRDRTIQIIEGSRVILP